MDKKAEYLIGGFAKRTGLSMHTLRYYEKEGLIMPRRNEAGRRVYGDGDIAWIDFIVRLKETGMPIREIQTYARLRDEGEATMPERLDMLKAHRAAICEKIKKWEANLVKMDKKIGIYEESIARMENPDQ